MFRRAKMTLGKMLFIIAGFKMNENRGVSVQKIS